MSQIHMPSGIMWAQRPGQQPYNPAPTGQNPQMPGMGWQSGQQSPPQGMPPPQGMGAPQSSPPSMPPQIQNWMPPNPNAMWQGAVGTPQMPFTGNNFGSQPMGGQTPGMGPGSPGPGANAPPMDTSGFSQSTGGSPFGANGQVSRTPTVNLSGPAQFSNILPKAPQRPRGIANQVAGSNPAAQYPFLARNTSQSAPTGNPTNGPLPSGGPGSTMTPGPVPANNPAAGNIMRPQNFTPQRPSAASTAAPGSLPTPNVMAAMGFNSGRGTRGLANSPAPFMSPGASASIGGHYSMNAAAMSGINQDQSPQAAIAQWRATGQVPSWWNMQRGMPNNQVGNANVNGSLNQAQ